MTPDELKAKVDALVQRVSDESVRVEDAVTLFKPVLLAAFEALAAIQKCTKSVNPKNIGLMKAVIELEVDVALALLEPK